MTKQTQEAIFAAGCFWGVEEHFRKMDGVVETEVGYIGGHTNQPDYKSVCGGDTEHAEAVRIVFDPAFLSYEGLLAQFWQCHDPTQKDRQGVDVGRQYRSAIFVHNQDQALQAEASKLTAQGQFARPIVTEIVQASIFFAAEDYHQHYIAKKKS